MIHDTEYIIIFFQVSLNVPKSFLDTRFLTKVDKYKSMQEDQGIYNLTWSTHSDHLKESLKEMMLSVFFCKYKNLVRFHIFKQ